MNSNNEGASLTRAINPRMPSAAQHLAIPFHIPRLFAISIQALPDARDSWRLERGFEQSSSANTHDYFLAFAIREYRSDRAKSTRLQESPFA
jgi:hypothetical protein